MLNNIKDLLDKNIVCNRHSDFQIEKFIVGKENTPNSQAWQCLRELESRYDSLVSLEMEVANILDDIEIKKIEIEEELERNTKKSKFIVRKIERTIESLKMNHQKLLEKKKNQEEECVTFINLFNKIDAKIKVKGWNDNNAQAEYFENKFGSELNLDFLLGHPVNKELVKSILQLENNSRLKHNLIESMNKQKGLLGNGQ
jgi:hypothetical protein